MKLLDQALECASLFNGVQIFALKVLNQGELERLLISDFPHQDGDTEQAGTLRCPPAALPGNEFVSRTHFSGDEGLDDARRAD
jgi:hypothetical protein